jgi:type IV secretion system protein TrbL
VDDVHGGGAVTAVRLRAGVVAAVGTLAALVVLAGVARAGLDPAGGGWDTGGFRAGVVLGAMAVTGFAAALGAAGGARAGLGGAAAAGSREEALVTAAGAAAAVGALLPLLGALVQGEGLAGGLLTALAAGAGALAGAAWGVRVSGRMRA